MFAQFPNFGGCPATSPVTGFNITRYLGKWFEIRSYPTYFNIGASCTQAEYSLFENGTVRVNNTALQYGGTVNVVGNAVLDDPNVGWLTVNFPSTGGPG